LLSEVPATHFRKFEKLCLGVRLETHITGCGLGILCHVLGRSFTGRSLENGVNDGELFGAESIESIEWAGSTSGGTARGATDRTVEETVDPGHWV
jgi:hypothetical protein